MEISLTEHVNTKHDGTNYVYFIFDSITELLDRSRFVVDTVRST